MARTAALAVLLLLAATSPAEIQARGQTGQSGPAPLEPGPEFGVTPQTPADEVPAGELPADMQELLLMMDLLEQYGEVLDTEEEPEDVELRKDAKPATP